MLVSIGRAAQTAQQGLRLLQRQAQGRGRAQAQAQAQGQSQSRPVLSHAPVQVPVQVPAPAPFQVSRICSSSSSFIMPVRKRLLSTAAAAATVSTASVESVPNTMEVMGEEHVQEPVYVPVREHVREHEHVPSTDDGRSRGKRLEQLRQRLEKESPLLDHFSSSSSSSPSPSKKNKKQTSTSMYKSAKSKADDVLELLKQLPPLPESTSVLTDRFMRPHSYLRISLSERCNLRCQYCMPPEGVPLQPEEHLLNRKEILQLANLFVTHGVDKIRLTGGEPLLRKDLKHIVHDLASIDGIHQVGMTTNGVTLNRHMDDLIAAGLTHVNISLDTLKEDKFTHLTRRPGLQKVMEAIREAAHKFPDNRVKINCVVMRNTNEDELVDFCRLTQDLPVDVRFIEWMPFFDNGWSHDEGLVPYQEMLDTVNSQLPLSRAVDGPNDTTKWWRLDGALGRIGFITSMSDHFCGSCNRLRLTADGQIKVCLFGSAELSLRDALRHPQVSTKDLETLIHHAVQRKDFALGGHGTPQGIADANDNRPMTLIGG